MNGFMLQLLDIIMDLQFMLTVKILLQVDSVHHLVTKVVMKDFS